MHDRVEPVYAEDVLRAGQRAGTERIITADTDFDRLPSVVRLDPVDVGEWGTAVIALAGD